jgi:hypothetical protein
VRLQPRTIKILALLATVVTVVAVAFVAVLVVAVDKAEPREPVISAFADGKAVKVAPLSYCSAELADCTTGAIAELNVPAGTALELSLPSVISDGKWRLVMTFQGPNGPEFWHIEYGPGERTTATVESKATPPQQLLGVEIQWPPAILDKAGRPITRAIWSIKTAG